MLGVIAVLWGGGIIASGITNGAAAETGPYAAGSFAASALGGALLVAGSWALISRFRKG